MTQALRQRTSRNLSQTSAVLTTSLVLTEADTQQMKAADKFDNTLNPAAVPIRGTAYV
ncbi:hypothetical protein RUE5091_03245 [Ruegeria denitrificans]|uniref:Uncharacterized protein n=1 Tax=Ruegeria denitrificans TaxID=1715692 RepID=A0A0P1INY3_9RHOB|nr:hypothetical protein RUE5091_03245 [Ruegeria denitrificans]